MDLLREKSDYDAVFNSEPTRKEKLGYIVCYGRKSPFVETQEMWFPIFPHLVVTHLEQRAAAVVIQSVLSVCMLGDYVSKDMQFLAHGYGERPYVAIS